MFKGRFDNVKWQMLPGSSYLQNHLASAVSQPYTMLHASTLISHYQDTAYKASLVGRTTNMGGQQTWEPLMAF